MRNFRNEGGRGAHGPTWPTVVRAYNTGRAAAGISDGHRAHGARVLRAFVAFVRTRGATAPAHIERKHLDAWHEFLTTTYRIPWGKSLGQTLKPTTLYDWLTMTWGLLTYLVVQELVLIDPRAGFQRPKCPKSRRRFIPTADEVARFLAAIPQSDTLGLRDRAVFELLYATGLRVREASRLDLYDIDLGDGVVRVRDGKGQQDRVVPMGTVAREVLRRYLDEARPKLWRVTSGDAVFVTKRGRRLTGTGITAQCEAWRDRAGMPGLTPHALRHAVATHMLLGGADVRHVQELLGHRHLTTTSLYTHLMPVDLMKAHHASHPRG